MKYLLIEPKTQSIAYNIALMKWSRWCENNDHEYQYVRGCVTPSIVPDKIYMSCIFSFYSKKYEQTIDYYRDMFPGVSILVGGVFPSLNPKWFNKEKWQNDDNGFFEDDGGVVDVFKGTHPDIEDLAPKYNVNILDEDSFNKSLNVQSNPAKKIKRIPLYASRGCVNKCGYCAVPKLEGDMKSFKSIRKFLDAAKKEQPEATSIVLYDNNFTEHEYVDDIIDEIVEYGYGVDIHGLHVEAFTPEFAKKIEKLKFVSQSNAKSTPYLRFSFDWVKYYPSVMKAHEIYCGMNTNAQFFCYMLYNWIDTPQDFWKRIVLSQKIVDAHGKSIYLFPQRYEPFMALEKYKYTGTHWTDEQAAGVRKMATFLHGFIAMTPTHNIFNWIGHTYEEFIERAELMSTDRTYRLTKKQGDPPSLEELLKTIEE